MATPCIRPPAVAGLFYPDEAAQLDATVARLVAAAHPEPDTACPKVLVVPHAGYIYSGPIAAEAYATLTAHAGSIRRVVLLGPCHRVPVHGIALPACDGFRTPLGEVPLDDAALARIRTLPGVCLYDEAHAAEHSLEVQLPFLQVVLPEFRLVPLAVGHADPAVVAHVLDALWGGPETLIVISTDLSHYRPYHEARELDRDTVARIVALQGPLDPMQACGAASLNGLLATAAKHALRGRVLDLRSSGDTAGDRTRVVGYCAIAFDETRGLTH